MSIFRDRNRPARPANQSHTVGRKKIFTPGTPIFCWRFKHPKFGWCGGDDDDAWSDSKKTMEMNMSHCQWPSELLEDVA